jgi:enoyl-CoA hydratase/carnithine racemase
MGHVSATSSVTRVNRGTTAVLRFCYRGTSPGLGAAMAGQLRGHLDDLVAELSQVNLLILRGEAGGDFCPASDADASDVLAQCVEHLYMLTVPVMAAVDNRCADAGVALALACDIVIVTDQTVLALQPADVDEKTVTVLSERAGRVRAAAMALTGASLTGVQAQQAGIAQVCVPSSDFEAAVARLTDAIGSASAQARAFIETADSSHPRGDDQQ